MTAKPDLYLSNAIVEFKTKMANYSLEVEEIKFKTHEAGTRFACAIKNEINTEAMPVVYDKGLKQIKIFGLIFTWPNN